MYTSKHFIIARLIFARDFARKPQILYSVLSQSVVLSYSTNMLVFRANTNLFSTNVAWLSYSWRHPRLVGVSRYPRWDYRCYWHWISLAVGGDDLITSPLVDTHVVPWVRATQVAIHTFTPAPGKNSAALNTASYSKSFLHVVPKWQACGWLIQLRPLTWQRTTKYSSVQRELKSTVCGYVCVCTYLWVRRVVDAAGFFLAHAYKWQTLSGGLLVGCYNC